MYWAGSCPRHHQQLQTKCGILRTTLFGPMHTDSRLVRVEQWRLGMEIILTSVMCACVCGGGGGGGFPPQR